MAGQIGDNDNNNPWQPDPTITPTGLVSVNKAIKIVGVDELAGGALDGTTNALVIYDSDGKTIMETLTFSSGSATSAQTYPSGKTLWIKYYYDTTIDSYKFWEVVVPSMNSADAESLSVNQITLRTREAGAYTDQLVSSTGITITDGAGLNTTGTANDTMSLTYTYFTTSDNTGYPSFTDPIYGDMKSVVWATVSGTGYETVSLSGFDGGFERGSTMYYYKVVSDDSVSKQKVGNDYVLPGSGSVTFNFDASGFTNSTSAYPTLQLYLKVYSAGTVFGNQWSPTYFEQRGDFGPYDFNGAEQTMVIYDV